MLPRLPAVLRLAMMAPTLTVRVMLGRTKMHMLMLRVVVLTLVVLLLCILRTMMAARLCCQSYPPNGVVDVIALSGARGRCWSCCWLR